MALRTLLGIFESAISPGFSLITGMWYTPREHVSRHSIWFAGNAIASIIGSLIAYGLLSYYGSIAQWKVQCSLPSDECLWLIKFSFYSYSSVLLPSRGPS